VSFVLLQEEKQRQMQCPRHEMLFKSKGDSSPVQHANAPLWGLGLGVVN